MTILLPPWRHLRAALGLEPSKPWRTNPNGHDLKIVHALHAESSVSEPVQSASESKSERYRGFYEEIQSTRSSTSPDTSRFVRREAVRDVGTSEVAESESFKKKKKNMNSWSLANLDKQFPSEKNIAVELVCGEFRSHDPHCINFLESVSRPTASCFKVWRIILNNEVM